MAILNGARGSGRLLSALGVVTAVAATPLLAITAPVGRAELDRALGVARGRDAERARFHTAYVFPVKGSIVQSVEVISEFRRAVLITEDHLKRGDWIFGQGGRNLSGESAAQSLKAWQGRLTIAAHLQFSPLHAYANVPPLEITVDGSPAVAAVDARTIPQSSFPLNGPGGRPNLATVVLVGADVESDFEAASLGSATRDVRVFVSGAESARVSVAFGKIE